MTAVKGQGYFFLIQVFAFNSGIQDYFPEAKPNPDPYLKHQFSPIKMVSLGFSEN